MERFDWLLIPCLSLVGIALVCEFIGSQLPIVGHQSEAAIVARYRPPSAPPPTSTGGSGTRQPLPVIR